MNLIKKKMFLYVLIKTAATIQHGYVFLNQIIKHFSVFCIHRNLKCNVVLFKNKKIGKIYMSCHEKEIFCTNKK